MDKEKDNNLIIADFKSECEKQTKKPANFSCHQTNPIYKKLLKLTHIELTGKKTDYKSFNKFKPEDLI